MKSIVVSSNGSILAYLGSILINEFYSLTTILPINKSMTVEQVVNPGNSKGEFKLFLVYAKYEDELDWRDIHWAIKNGMKVIIYSEISLKLNSENLFQSKVSLSDRLAVIQEIKEILHNDVCVMAG